MDGKRAVFLPLDDRILTLYKGYTRNGVIDTSITEDDIYPQVFKCEIKQEGIGRIANITMGVLMIPLIPLLALIYIIEAGIRGRYFDADSPHMFFNKLTKGYLPRLFAFFLPKDRYNIEKYRSRHPRFNDKNKDPDVHYWDDDIPAALEHCKALSVQVYIYAYKPIDAAQQEKLEHLIARRYVKSYTIVTRLSDLRQLVMAENISIHNSWMVITDFEEQHEAKKLGIVTEDKSAHRLFFWYHDIIGYGNKDASGYWQPRLRKLQYIINDYLYAKDPLFFTYEYIFYVEDHYDEAINEFLTNNYDAINQVLAPHKKQLLYLPALRRNDSSMWHTVLAHLRYHYPVFYGLPDEQMHMAFVTLLDTESPVFFYKMILEQLDLPLFERPAFIRNICDGSGMWKEYEFTHTTITYQEGDDLKPIISKHLTNIIQPFITGTAHKVIDYAEDQYNADEYFNSVLKNDTEAVLKKMEQLKAEGKFGLLAEVIMHALKNSNNETLPVIREIQQRLHKNELLATEQKKSPILLDAEKRIILPAYGNQEIKMPTLSKVVYLLFLKYPTGIRFKDLHRHKTELLDIYMRLTSKYDEEEIKRSIDDLVDIHHPSLNQKCSRIREAFRLVMDEEQAKQYYIDGPKGEAKKIAKAGTFINQSKLLKD